MLNKELQDMLSKHAGDLEVNLELIDHEDRWLYSPIYRIKRVDDELFISGDWEPREKLAQED